MNSMEDSLLRTLELINQGYNTPKKIKKLIACHQQVLKSTPVSQITSVAQSMTPVPSVDGLSFIEVLCRKGTPQEMSERELFEELQTLPRGQALTYSLEELEQATKWRKRDVRSRKHINSAVHTALRDLKLKFGNKDSFKQSVSLTKRSRLLMITCSN